jgi:hypothetical protein
MVESTRVELPKKEKEPVRVVVEATAYFLSGLFLLTTTIIHVSGSDISLEIPSTNVSLAIGSWLTLFIGSLLTLTGFVYLCSTFIKPLSILFDINKQYEKYLVAFLFATVTTEVVKRIVEIRNILPLLIISIAFAVLILVVIVIKSLSVFNNISQLVSMSCAMVAMGIFAVFSSYPLSIRWDLFTILVITLLLLLRAASLFYKKPKEINDTTKKETSDITE